jgi:hypothetical protein
MYELVNTTEAAELIGEYDTLAEAREAREMYQNEHPENYYQIYKVSRVSVV